MPEEDLVHLRAGDQIGVDLVALSFVRRPEDVLFVREHTRIPLIAKIEKPQAVERAEEIIRVATASWSRAATWASSCRSRRCRSSRSACCACPASTRASSITATQMLDSMVRSARPTRAEVADVANAILDGTDAVMLSQETAVGAYPVEAVAMMDSVARTTEREAPYARWNEIACAAPAATPATRSPTASSRPRASWSSTRSSSRRSRGRSARLVSAHRPTVPILALSPGKETVRRCGLMWGVRAASMRKPRGHRGADRRRRAPRRRARLVPARPARRHHRRACRAASPGTTSMFQVQRLDDPGRRSRRPHAATTRRADRRVRLAVGSRPSGSGRRARPLAQQVAAHEHQPDRRPSPMMIATAMIASGLDRSPNEPPSAT